MNAVSTLIHDQRVHVIDGAMGTQLYEHGVFVNVCYDEVTLSRPEIVSDIHRAYLDAGAEILETNTFGANPVKLSGFGLEKRTAEINREAALLARGVAGTRAAVVGAIGPLGIRIEPWGPTSVDEARGYFRRQIAGLIEGGVDAFMLETFSDVNEAHQAILAIRERSDLPIIAQVSVEEGGRTAHGTDAEDAAVSLEAWGADVIGVNCSVGPADMLDVIMRVRRSTSRPLVAQPNAGLPRAVGDRKIYMAGPAYMARYATRLVEAGVRFVGGCCGTTPDHIRAFRAALEPVAGRVPPGEGFVRDRGSIEVRDAAPAPLAERSRLGGMLASGEPIVSVELVPPEGWDPRGLIAAAQEAVDEGANLVTVAEISTGPRRMGAIAAAMLLAERIPVETAIRVSCRDRTMGRMISDLLGGMAGGVRNVIAVSGAPTRMGPYPDRTAVFDLDSVGLTRVLAEMNRGREPGGTRLDGPTAFVAGVVVSPGADDLARERDRFREKVEGGADFAITLPVFDAVGLLRLLDEMDDPVPVVLGVAPLTSSRDAEYLAQEVPGVHVPDEVVQRMVSAEERGLDAASEEGLLIAHEVIDQVRDRVRGIHLVPLRSRCPVTLGLLRGLRALR